MKKTNLSFYKNVFYNEIMKCPVHSSTITLIVMFYEVLRNERST